MTQYDEIINKLDELLEIKKRKFQKNSFSQKNKWMKVDPAVRKFSSIKANYFRSLNSVGEEKAKARIIDKYGIEVLERILGKD